MKPFIPGQTFKNNKYYWFDKYGVTVLKPWPDMLAFRKTKTRGWRAIRPKFSFREHAIPNKNNKSQCYRCYLNTVLEKTVEHQCKPDPLISFLEAVPDELLQLIKDVNSRQWHLLALFARCGKEAIDLYKSTPALAWMLASSWTFKNKPVKNNFRSVRALLKPGKSQLDILKWLDFPSSKQAIKLLRKVDMRDIDVTLLLNLKSVITNKSSLKSLSHLSRIDASIIGLLASQPCTYSYKFLLHYQTLEREQRYEVKKTISFTSSESEFNKTFDVKALIEMVDATQHNAEQKVVNHHRIFPWPEYELAECFPEIEYIDTEDALIREGIGMNNCLANYVEDAYSGKVNFYTLTDGEKAVFSVLRSDDKKCWIVNEIKGICNQQVSDTTIKTVENWLDELNRLNPAIEFYSAFERAAI